MTMSKSKEVDVNEIATRLIMTMSSKKVDVNEIATRLIMTMSKPKKVDVNEIATRLGNKKSAALIGFHAFTGSDVCGKFIHKGKTTWWKAYNNGNEELYDALISLGDYTKISDETFAVLERLVSEVYSQTSRKITTIPEIRYWLFSKKSLESEKLPPTRGALKEHILRACYQTSVWAQADIADPNIPEINSCGWKYTEEGYVPNTSATPIAPDAVLILVRCGCGEKCSTKRCTCVKNNFSCTDGCGCTDSCKNTDNIRECNHVKINNEEAAEF